jgi:hypothetical protein
MKNDPTWRPKEPEMLGYMIAYSLSAIMLGGIYLGSIILYKIFHWMLSERSKLGGVMMLVVILSLTVVIHKIKTKTHGLVKRVLVSFLESSFLCLILYVGSYGIVCGVNYLLNNHPILGLFIFSFVYWRLSRLTNDSEILFLS